VWDQASSVHNGIVMFETTTDGQLVSLYIGGDVNAFAELVRRHTPLVYSAAVRQTGQPHLAEEVTQVVFVLLASRARRFGSGVVVSAWLYQAARYAAKDAMKKQRRRQFYEAKAALSADTASQAIDATGIWPDIAPILDDAMDSLHEKDRTAVLTRFFEGRSLREVGTIMGTSEAAAGQRISRAIERLRRFIAARGVIVPAAGLGVAMTQRAIGAAPERLASLAAQAASTPNPIQIAIANGARKMMFWTRPKIFAVAASVAACAIAAPAIILVSQAHAAGTPTQQPVEERAKSTSQLFTGALPEKGTLQVCLTNLDDPSPRFWNPDGSLLDPAPVQVVAEKPTETLKSGQHRIAVLIRATDAQDQNVAVSFSAGANSLGFRLGGAKVEKDGKPLKNWWVEIVTVDARAKGFVVDVGLALGKWIKLATWGTYGQTGTMLTDDRRFVAEAGIPAERNGELSVAMALQLPQVSDWDQRLFAVLRNGTRQRDSTRLNMRIMNGVGMTSFVFRQEQSVKPDDVASYELEVLPYTKLSLKDLPTVPGSLRQPNIQITNPQPLPKLKAQ
jgi:RNA polymerase sigma factor (sigma-70 family)